MKVCMKCGHISPDEENVCPLCGTPFGEMRSEEGKGGEACYGHEKEAEPDFGTNPFDDRPEEAFHEVDFSPEASMAKEAEKQKELSAAEISKIFQKQITHIYGFLSLLFATVIWIFMTIYAFSLKEEVGPFYVIPLVLMIVYIISILGTWVNWFGTIRTLDKRGGFPVVNGKPALKLDRRIVFKGMTVSCFSGWLSIIFAVAAIMTMCGAVLGNIPLVLIILCAVYGGLLTIFLIVIAILEAALGK